MPSFSYKLLNWHDPAARMLPWKKDASPYKTWLSEIILQQTRVEQGMPYYLAFVERFPTVKALAEAPLDDVLKLWEGLGYYSRARNLHASARQVMNEHNGIFPSAYENILRLKGVGNYTAAAIASFAFNLPHAVVDGNVYRLLSRVFGIELPVDSTEGKKRFSALAQSLLDKKNPSGYNQAIMDFGSMVCKPQNPLCSQCPFSSDCIAFNRNIISMLPVKAKKIIKSERYFHYLVMHDDSHIFIRQRTEKDIWKGLFEFPMEERPRFRLRRSELLKNMHANLSILKPQKFSFRQTLSHQYINGNFYEIRISKLPKPQSGYLKISKTSLPAYAFPKIVRSYLQERLNFLS
jgi:A/G-specific adenine glycosylase